MEKKEDIDVFLQHITTYYNKSKFLKSDPIEFCYKYNKQTDIEIVAYIASMFSYGNVVSIRNFLHSLFQIMKPSPYKYIQQGNFENLNSHKIYYRFQNSQDIYYFLRIISILLKNNSSLENLFGNTNDPINYRIITFQNQFKKQLNNLKYPLTNGLKFLIGSSNLNSANKRYCMFLRWMVRDGFPDFGFYKTFDKKKLKYPLDVHIFKFIHFFSIKCHKTINYKLACIVTEFFKSYSPEDPLIFDFPLSRLGIINSCEGKYVKEICLKCELKKSCFMYKKNKSLG